ncbi:MAG: hypothetical protein JSS81_30125 [Acidobacteria bacterium]|nr:hypothetical protein [Acidobacteriota bacterium]
MRPKKSFKINFRQFLFVVLFSMLAATVAGAQALETRRVDLKGCIRLTMKGRAIIREQAAFLKAVRDDAGRERCLKDLEKIDFEKYTLLGAQLNTGYCREPLGLDAWTLADEEKKRYVLKISYLEPEGVCRALSRYDLWVLVPRLPENYTVEFEVAAIPNPPPRRGTPSS